MAKEPEIQLQSTDLLPAIPTSPNNPVDYNKCVPTISIMPEAISTVPSPWFPDDPSFSTAAIDALRRQGFPMGLAQELGRMRSTYPLRFWVIDNSGSMRTSDGHELRGTSQQLQLVPCTRWKELQGTIEYHIEMAGLMKSTTIFRLLNDPGANVGPQEFSVAETPGMIEKDIVRGIGIIRKAEPLGLTPLAKHIQVICERIQSVETQLRSRGQKVVVVLATDGLPTDGDKLMSRDAFVEVLRKLQSLPVWLVVRLCTDEEEVVSFYNDLDKLLEIPLEVIDDFVGEATEVYPCNKWLNYTLPLHRCREMGYHHRIFDLLDERQLNKDELLEFLQLVFGKDVFSDAPDMHVDWNGFEKVVHDAVQFEGVQWNAALKKQTLWIDMKQLRKIYGHRKTGLFGCRFGRRK
jgi:hypothetical protein